MLLHGGQAKASRILSEESARIISKPHFYLKENESWGFGVRVITSDTYPHLPVGSFGWSGAYGTHYWVDPANQITAIYMKNSHYDGGSGALTGKHFEEDVCSSII